LSVSVSAKLTLSQGKSDKNQLLMHMVHGDNITENQMSQQSDTEQCNIFYWHKMPNFQQCHLW